MVTQHLERRARTTLSCAAATLITATFIFAIPAPVRADAANSTPGTDFQIARGRYIVTISACNECHTKGYAGRAGQVPESEWLTGAAVGYQGPWGTSYPSNLRLTVAAMTESDWLVFARAPRLPPMPWSTLREMRDDDLRAVYHFIRSLGPKGERAPPAAGPGIAVNTPFIVFTPQNPAKPDTGKSSP